MLSRERTISLSLFGLSTSASYFDIQENKPSQIPVNFEQILSNAGFEGIENENLNKILAYTEQTRKYSLFSNAKEIDSLYVLKQLLLQSHENEEFEIDDPRMSKVPIPFSDSNNRVILETFDGQKLELDECFEQMLRFIITTILQNHTIQSIENEKFLFVIPGVSNHLLENILQQMYEKIENMRNIEFISEEQSIIAEYSRQNSPHNLLREGSIILLCKCDEESLKISICQVVRMIENIPEVEIIDVINHFTIGEVSLVNILYYYISKQIDELCK